MRPKRVTAREIAALAMLGLGEVTRVLRVVRLMAVWGGRGVRVG